MNEYQIVVARDGKFLFSTDWGPPERARAKRCGHTSGYWLTSNGVYPSSVNTACHRTIYRSRNMLNTAELTPVVLGAPRGVQRSLRDFAKFPTERNACYWTGYITALYEFDVLTHDQHTVFLALSGVLQRDQVICALLINIIEV